MPLFEEFSAGYYIGRLYIGLYDGEYAVMKRDQHEETNEHVYATGEGVERVDQPLVVKVDESHFPFSGLMTCPRTRLHSPMSFSKRRGSRAPRQ